MSPLTNKEFAARKLLKELSDEVHDIKHFNENEDIALLSGKLNSLEKLIQTISEESQFQNQEKLRNLTTLYNKVNDSKNRLTQLTENTTSRIWSINKNLQITALNQNFLNDFEKAYGVVLKEGISILISLPEPYKSTWKDRYTRALKGEQFSIIDDFSSKNFSLYTETIFNPIIVSEEVIGVTCYSHDVTGIISSDKPFKYLVEISPNPITILSKHGYLFVNNAWVELTGFSKQEALNWELEDLYNIYEKEKIHSALGTINKKEAKSRQIIRINTKKKGTLYVDIATTPINFENTNALISIGTDITPLIELQNELIQYKENLTALFETTNQRIWSVDPDLNLITFNTNFVNFLTELYNTTPIPGMSILYPLSKQEEKIWAERYKKALTQEYLKFIDEFTIQGKKHYSEITLKPFFSIDNSLLGIAAYSQDISQRITAELALKDSEQRYKTLVENIPSVTYRCKNDQLRTMFYISDEIEKLSGYLPSDFIENNIRSFNTIIHPDDIHLVYNSLENGVKNKTSYKIEYRIKNKQGETRWVNERGRAIFNKNGILRWLDGVITDVTQQKDAEEALRESEEQYRAIFNSMSDVYIRTNLNGDISIISPSIIDLMGYSPEEVIGKNLEYFLLPSNNRKEITQELIKKGFLQDFEFSISLKNGIKKAISLNAKLIINTKGVPVGIDAVIRDITLNRMAQQALEERTREINTIFENIHAILMLIDENCNILNINKSAGKTNSMEPQYTNLLAGEVIRCINTIRTKSACNKGEVCRNCSIWKIITDTINNHRDYKQIEGSTTIIQQEQMIERHFLISTAYIPYEKGNRILVSIDDITDMRNAEEEIRRLSVAVNQSTTTIVITDISGRIEYVNPQFEKMTGYNAIEVIGKNPRILKARKRSRTNYRELWTTILNGKTWQGEFYNKRKDGSTYWESANISPITNRNGQITHFIAVKEDITEKKRIQEELIKSESELREMNEEKSRYLSILAHDLRGLVGSFHAYANLIDTHYDEFSDTDIREQISLLTKASGDSLNLLDNLLEWGKSTSGTLSMEIEELDLDQQVKIVLGVLTEVAGNKKVKLINNIDEGIIIQTDPNVLQTIIRNLVNNAIKFTPPEGSITIKSQKNNEGLIEISIVDTGVGMDENVQKQIFELGNKSVREGTNKEKGTGLGLSICKELVRKIGGTLHVESQAGKGSRFYFIIPTKTRLPKSI